MTENNGAPFGPGYSAEPESASGLHPTGEYPSRGGGFEPENAPGYVTWACSEEDGLPDVGLWLCVMPGTWLWAGELSDRAFEDAGEEASDLGDKPSGWWLVINQMQDGKLVERVVGRTTRWAASDMLDLLGAAIRASAIEAQRAETKSGSGEAESAARRETPEIRARSTYELLISDPHRPGALATLTEAFREAENDALERAAETAEAWWRDEHEEPAPDDPTTAAAAIRALKHKHP